ncbi:unnamed protein product [Brassica oleracea]|uniref:(rape) hypothetical protein n=1 Tax=Brassica napus TaxID=3708 RepID=A0A816Q827_BRANA|nr:unnamed protein product [Brassica napus]
MFNQNKNNKIMSFDRHTLTPNLMFKASRHQILSFTSITLLSFFLSTPNSHLVS